MTNLSHSIRVGQLEIHAEEVGEGSPALVFFHYWGGSRRTWSEVIARLSNRFRSIAVDLRGWGKSARHTDDYSLFTQANDVEGVIKALNVKDFVLVGHSMGAKSPRYWQVGDRKACVLLFLSLPRRRRHFKSRTRKSERCSLVTQCRRASGRRSKSSAIGLLPSPSVCKSPRIRSVAQRPRRLHGYRRGCCSTSPSRPPLSPSQYV